jgi:quercetin dioxygenase-like cupin family protein
MYFAFESETEPAAANAPLDVHAHSRYDESEYVLTGSRDIVVGEQRWDASSGFFALAPRHARHAMRTIGAAPSRWLHFFSPAEIERYFVERERLREAGANADELRALSEQFGVGATIQSQSAEPAYVSSPGARRDGVVVTGRATRNAYALAERVALPEDEHVHADQEEAFYVISGTLLIEIEGVTLTASARSFVLAPRGVRRRHIAAPGTTVLTIFSPGHTVPHEPSARF